MMKLKYFLLPAAIAMLGGAQVFAGDDGKNAKPTPKDKPTECTFVKDQLKLNDEQCQKLKALIDEIKQIREANKKAVDELNVKTDEKAAETLAKAREFINELQFQKLIIVLDRLQNRMAPHHPGFQQPGPQGMMQGPQGMHHPGPQGMPCGQPGAKCGMMGQQPGPQGMPCGQPGAKCGMMGQPGPGAQCGGQPGQPGPQMTPPPAPDANAAQPTDKPADDKK